MPSLRVLRSVEGLPEDVAEAAERLRRFRNQLVHGIEVPDAELIHAQTAELRVVVQKLRDITTPKRKSARHPSRKKSDN